MSRHVLMVSSQYPPVYGGAGAQAEILGRELVRRGWKVSVVTLDQFAVGTAVEEGVRVTRVLRAFSARGALTRLVTTVALGARAAVSVLVRRPDVVHVHGVFWWSILPVMAGRLIGATTVLKVTRDGQDDARTVLSKRIGPVRVGWLYGTSLRFADHIVVLNQASFDDAGSLGLGGKTVLMRNGVATDDYARTPARRAQARAKLLIGPQDRVVLFAGFLVRHKGILDLLEAWRRRGDRETKLLLAGPVVGFYRELQDGVGPAISELVDDGYAVEVLGHVPREEMPTVYWAADTFTLPSYSEGMPNSLMEATVAGCQIVATSIGGIVDLVDDTEAWLVEPGDVEQLATALTQSLEGPQKPTGDVAAAMSIGVVASRYESLYAKAR